MNGIDITVAPHDQAVALLTGIRGEISLVVSRDQHDVTPQATNHGASSTVTWPTTPLDASTLPIIVQPPTPNYAVVESPGDEQQAPAVVKDATDVAMDSAEVEIGSAADVDKWPAETTQSDAGESEQLEHDLMDFSTPTCEVVTSHYGDVITVSDAAADIAVELRTTELSMAPPFSEYADIDFDIDDDDDDLLLRPAAVSGVSVSPMSSDIRDMIQHGMLDTLRLL